LSVIDRARLALLLGMMGSDHDGEALNAARTAHGMVREARLSWPEILEREPPASNVARLRGDVERLLGHCRCCRLNPWGRDFLASMAERSGGLSPKQAAALERIKSKVARHHGRAA